MRVHVTVLCITPQRTVEMDSKSILVSVVIGILVGGIVGYQLVPTPDYSPYEDQIAQLHSQVSSLSSELDDAESQLKEAPSQQARAILHYKL